MLPCHASPRHRFRCLSRSTPPPRTPTPQLRLSTATNLNLDLTQSAISCIYLNSDSVSLNLCAITMSAAPTGSIVNFSAAALHILRSATCRAAGKGAKTVTQEYRPSKRVKDQEAGPVGGAGTCLVRPAAPGMAYCTR
jgi:hypothetical protein